MALPFLTSGHSHGLCQYPSQCLGQSLSQFISQCLNSAALHEEYKAPGKQINSKNEDENANNSKKGLSSKQNDNNVFSLSGSITVRCLASYNIAMQCIETSISIWTLGFQEHGVRLSKVSSSSIHHCLFLATKQALHTVISLTHSLTHRELAPIGIRRKTGTGRDI